MRPDVHQVAEQLYGALGRGFTREDGEDTAWATLIWCDALGAPFERFYDLVVANGWQDLFNVDRCPAWALPYLATVVGARLFRGLDEEGMRLTIRSINSETRGGPDAFEAAARQLLTGTRSIKVDERFEGNPKRVRIRTYTAETPDPAAVEAAIRAEKPAFLVLTYDVFQGATLEEVRDSGMTLAQVRDTFPTLNDLRTWIPAEEPV